MPARKAKASSRGEKVGVILPDTHFPLEDKRAWDCALQIIGHVKPDILVHLGDVGEWHSISHWRYKRISRPPLEYQLSDLEPELAGVNIQMDRLDDACKTVREKHLTMGNHDDWLNQFVEAHPYLPQYLPENAMFLDKRGYSWKPPGEYLKIGKLFFYHGHHYRNQYHARQHAEKLGVSVIYGHHHDQQTHGVQHLGGSHRAWSLGCLRTMDADFLGGRPTNWSHNVGIVHWLPSGNFHVQVVDIIDGEAFVWGKNIVGTIGPKTKRSKQERVA